MKTFCGAGSAATKDGYAVHVYTFNADMERSCMANADGDFLIVPQLGELRVKTEMGTMRVPPGHVCVVPRGIRFSVGLEKRMTRKEEFISRRRQTRGEMEGKNKAREAAVEAEAEEVVVAAEEAIRRMTKASITSCASP